MVSRTEQKAETKRRVIACAVDLFTERGFTDTSTADIAKALGLSHGAVFVHFPTRDDLVLVAAREMGRAITDRLHALVHDGQSLKDVLEAHVQALREHEAQYRRLLVDRPQLPVELQRAWLGIQSAIASYIGAAAKRERGLRKVPEHLLFNTWLGLVHHYLANAEIFAPNGSVLERHGSTLVEHYLSLLKEKRS
jgi:AcrR family transcriptional regulator